MLWSKLFILVIDNDCFVKYKICVYVCEVYDVLVNVFKINNNCYYCFWIIYKWFYEFIYDIIKYLIIYLMFMFWRLDFKIYNLDEEGLF